MTVREVVDIFSHLWDKYRDEGITHAEMMRHINTATVLYLIESFYNNDDQSKRSEYMEPHKGFENTQYDIEAWHSLVCPITIKTDADGCVTHEAIRNKFPDDPVRDEMGLIEVRKPELYHINSVGVWVAHEEYCSARWVRHNEREWITKNPFKKPTKDCPTSIRFKNKLQIEPKGVKLLRLSVTRMPLHIWYDEDNPVLNIDPELPTSTMHQIILRALGLAGINTNDRELYQFSQNESNRQ